MKGCCGIVTRLAITAICVCSPVFGLRFRNHVTGHDRRHQPFNKISLDDNDMNARGKSRSPIVQRNVIQSDRNNVRNSMQPLLTNYLNTYGMGESVGYVLAAATFPIETVEQLAKSIVKRTKKLLFDGEKAKEFIKEAKELSGDESAANGAEEVIAKESAGATVRASEEAAAENEFTENYSRVKQNTLQWNHPAYKTKAEAEGMVTGIPTIYKKLSTEEEERLHGLSMEIYKKLRSYNWFWIRKKRGLNNLKEKTVRIYLEKQGLTKKEMTLEKIQKAMTLIQPNARKHFNLARDRVNTDLVNHLEKFMEARGITEEIEKRTASKIKSEYDIANHP